MLKPLELTIYPLELTFPAGYKLPRDTRISYRAADRMAAEKRLTEPELAAEYHRARDDDFAICEGLNWGDQCEGWTTFEAAALARTATLLRFATLPHALDEEVTP